MVRIKVCGLTNKKDALAVVNLDVWAVGFIFYKKSSRYVEPKDVKKIIDALSSKTLTVGVFVNQEEQEINDIVKTCGLKAVQFHGDETPKECMKIKGVKTIKAIRVKNKKDILKAAKYKTDYLLFDTFKEKVFGGTGKVFDWNLLKDKSLNKRKVILSGGLNPKNIVEAASSVKAYAFDVSSGVERRPGKKCHRLLKTFFKQID